MSEQNGGQAFPTTTREGMTLRDYFAGQALIAMGMWTPSYKASIGGKVFDFEIQAARARFAYEQADAMLEARGKPDVQS